MIGLYLHVPFCARECEFCAFYKEKADRKVIDLYLSTIEAELKKFPPTKAISTIFMGGGTPTLLTAGDLDRLCGAVNEAVSTSYSADKGSRSTGLVEWTIECAPATLKKDKIDVLKKHGVNRFSLGVQSFNETTLQAIGRPHSKKQVTEALAMLKGEVENWNIDLIFAAAQSTLPDWLQDLETALSLESKHISTYCLTFESDTEFFLKMLKGAKKKPSPAEEELFYKKTWECLRAAGLHHYEVSNFARPGYECLHNLNTWRMGEWVAYGPSGSSQVELCRATNVPDVTKWAEGVNSGKRALIDESTLTLKEMALDALVFGLRMPGGVDVKEIQERFAALDKKQLELFAKELCDEGYAKIDGPCWKLSDEGLLVADRIGLEIMERLG